MKLEGESKKYWHLIIRWLHDALLEDALDKAEAILQDKPIVYREPNWLVRFLIKQVRKKREKAAMIKN